MDSNNKEKEIDVIDMKLVSISREIQKEENKKNLIIGIILTIAGLGCFFGGAAIADSVKAGPFMMIGGALLFAIGIFCFAQIKDANKETCPNCGHRTLLLQTENSSTYRKEVKREKAYKEHEGTDTTVTMTSDTTATVSLGSSGWSEFIGWNVYYDVFCKCPNCGHAYKYMSASEFIKKKDGEF